jgi:hypothetical protein
MRFSPDTPHATGMRLAGSLPAEFQQLENIKLRTSIYSMAVEEDDVMTISSTGQDYMQKEHEQMLWLWRNQEFPGFQPRSIPGLPRTMGGFLVVGYTYGEVIPPWFHRGRPNLSMSGSPSISWPAALYFEQNPRLESAAVGCLLAY